MTDSKSPTWKTSVASLLMQHTTAVEEQVDIAWNRLRGFMGWDRVEHIAAYTGYSDGRSAFLQGRLLANQAEGGPKEDDSWWHNLLNTYRRFETDEIPNHPVTVRVGEDAERLHTDAEGYYQTALPLSDPIASFWTDGSAATKSSHHDMVTSKHRILTPGPQAQYGVISDVDDTILHTDATRLLTMARLTFLHNARTRKPLEGVGELYQILQSGHHKEPVNPIFYVSSSPWNLYDLLVDFMELNAIPHGPLMLRDFGLNPGDTGGTNDHSHKLAKALTIMRRLPNLPFILIGDSGQRDAELYASAAEQLGDRIIGIYIRDVDPVVDSDRDKQVDTHIEQAADHGVHMQRVTASDDIAHDLNRRGILNHVEEAEVVKAAKRDAQRPDMAEAVAAS